MPVVRNPQFYFREGFCWSDINTTYLKSRIKFKTINDVKSMSLYSLTDKIPAYFFVCLLNSTFFSYYVDDFVNNTQTFQINDARQLPIVVPSTSQLKNFKMIFDWAIRVKENELNTKSTDVVTLLEIQSELDNLLEKLYDLQSIE